LRSVAREAVDLVDRAAESAARDGHRRSRTPAPDSPRAEVGWEQRLVKLLLARADKTKKLEEDPLWTVRERLAARAGRVHALREARRLLKEADAPSSVRAPSSDVEAVLPKKKKRRKHRRRRSRRHGERGDDGASRGRRRKRSRSRSPSSSTSSSSSTVSSARPFRGAPSEARTGTQTQRDSKLRGHVVLIETLTEIAGVLPRASEGATLSQAELYRKLPPLFSLWFSMVLEPKLVQRSNGERNLREAKTLVKIMDHLMRGETLPGLVTALGRLKAITAVSTEPDATWRTAQLHELVTTDSTGLLTRRDRTNAAAALRDQARLQGGGRGAPLAPVL
jgi:hypothetical protein